MMNNNHKDPGCAFGETLVEYLYGETNGAQKAEFEKHLNKCETCADELAAFSGVHFAIDDWKAQEFAPLATPAIEIPYDRKVEVSDVKGSWLSAFVRDLFSFSPRAWTLTTATAAVLVVFAGLAFFALKSGEDNEITQKNPKPAVTPTSEKTPPASNANIAPNNEQTAPKDAPQPDVAVSGDQTPKNNRAVKISNNPRPVQKNDAQKNNSPKRNDKNRAAPKVLPDDDDEDDSLRLSELFAEIDAE